jgi:CubicO group peptidase (beta-lactamase class C family)
VAPPSPETVARSQHALDAAIEADSPGCSAAVGVEGRVVWTGVRGVADVDTGAKITPDTVFDIASVSKQFTAAVILLLAQGNRLTLDDALSKYVPELPAWADTVNLGQLMHQTSGIPDYVVMLQNQGFAYSDETTQAQAVQALAGVQNLEYQPGTQFEYSNSNYLLLGEIAQRLTGKPLSELLFTDIFKPLGLAMVLDPRDDLPNEAVPYDRGDGDYTVAVTNWEQVGDGGIQSTPSQLVRWADNYRTGAVGGHTLLEAQVADAAETDPDSDERYGAGIFVLSNGMLDHDGSWAGYLTSFRVSPDRRTSIAVSCNAGDRDPEALADALGEIWM